MRLLDKIFDHNTQDSYLRMLDEIEKKGGKLTFVVKTDAEGWSADCQEFPAIITGGSNTNPSQEEVMHSIIESVKTAFHVPISELKKVETKTQVKTPTIEVARYEREFQLA